MTLVFTVYVYSIPDNKTCGKYFDFKLELKEDSAAVSSFPLHEVLSTTSCYSVKRKALNLGMISGKWTRLLQK